MDDRVCRCCGVDIAVRHRKAIYCSVACRKWFIRNGTARVRASETCLQCGASLHDKMVSALYCTRKCKMRAVELRRDRDDAARYLRERDRRIEYATRYARENPQIGQASKRRRRAVQSSATAGRFTGADWLRVQRRFGFRCSYCGASGKMTMDHVVPIVRGGQHSEGNIVPACFSCNCRKQGRFVMEWRLNKSRKTGRSGVSHYPLEAKR